MNFSILTDGNTFSTVKFNQRNSLNIIHSVYGLLRLVNMTDIITLQLIAREVKFRKIKRNSSRTQISCFQSNKVIREKKKRNLNVKCLFCNQTHMSSEFIVPNVVKRFLDRIMAFNVRSDDHRNLQQIYITILIKPTCT